MSSSKGSFGTKSRHQQQELDSEVCREKPTVKPDKHTGFAAPGYNVTRLSSFMEGKENRDTPEVEHCLPCLGHETSWGQTLAEKTTKLNSTMPVRTDIN